MFVFTTVIGDNMTPERNTHTTIWIERTAREKLGELAEQNHRTISGQIAYMIEKEYTRNLNSNEKKFCQDQTK
jgi:hypothetical protein